MNGTNEMLFYIETKRLGSINDCKLIRGHNDIEI